MAIKNCDLSYFWEIWDGFREEVRCKHYNKIPYDTWRAMMAAGHSAHTIFISNNCPRSSELIVDFWIDKDKSITNFSFNMNDESFGSYLYNITQPDTFITCRDKKPQDSNYTSSTRLNSWDSVQEVFAATSLQATNATNSMSSLSDSIKKIMAPNPIGANNTTTRKENNDMNTNNMFGNFDFGPVKENIKLSMYGMAVVGQDGRYIAYDAATDSMVDVEAFNFAAKSMLYKMPVATKDVKVGDTVIHLRKPMYVKEVVDANSLIVIDYVTSEEKIIKPVKNMFGFNFYTKVVNFLENAMPNTTTANADNPFGNMWMFALMGEESADSALAIAMMLANQNGTAATANPFMLAMLMSDNKFEGNNLLPMLMMSQMMSAPKAE